MQTTLLRAVMVMLVSAGAHAHSWQSASHDALLSSLHTQFPLVEEWQAVPLVSRRQQEMLDQMDDVTVDVVRMGKRSAVRIATIRGERPTRATVWFAVTALQTVPVASMDLGAGEVVGEHSLTTALTDVFDLGCTPATDVTRAVGMRLRASVAAGGGLCAEHLKVPPLVTRGERVSVRSVAGLVTIQTTGVAQQDGDLGKVLRVRNANSGATFLAAVTGRGEVTVHE